jgi:hypothetical protein
MASNTYLFRDGYSEKDMRDRLSVSDFRDSDHPEIDQILSEADLDSDHIYKNRMEVFLSDIKDAVGKDRYEQFLETIFEDRGEKGDRFNVQFYHAPNLSLTNLSNTVSEKIDKFDDDDNAVIDTPIRLSDYDQNNNQIMDLEFEVIDQREVVELEDAVSAYVSEEGRLEIEEAGIEQIERIYKQGSYPVEARAYCEDGLITISRSQGKNPVRKGIKNLIKMWGSEQ